MVVRFVGRASAPDFSAKRRLASLLSIWSISKSGAEARPTNLTTVQAFH